MKSQPPVRAARTSCAASDMTTSGGVGIAYPLTVAVPASRPTGTDRPGQSAVFSASQRWTSGFQAMPFHGS
jgi:hypothetical protein